MKKNVWLPIESLPEIQVGQYIVPNFVSNSVAIKVNEKEYILISPGASLLSSWPDELKTPQCKIHIIMPNAWHFMGVSAWLEVYKDAKLYTSAMAKEKLIEKGAFSSSQNILALEDNLPPLPQGYELLFPPGHRAGDVWVTRKNQTTPIQQKPNQSRLYPDKSHEPQDNSSTWITCDSFLNYERLSNQPFARTMQKLLGAAPGLKMSQVVKWLILNDKKAFKDWVLKQLNQDNPTILIPSHGEVSLDSHLKDKITSMVTSRL